MVVAVNSDSRGLQAPGEERAQAGSDPRLELDHFARVLARILGQLVELASQEFHRPQRQAAQRLVDGTLVLLGDQLWRKRRFVWVRCKRGVQLGGAPAQQLRRFDVRADGPGRDLSRTSRDWRQQASPERGRIAGCGQFDSLEEMGEGLQREGPRIALIRHVTLEDRHRDRLAFVAPVFEAAGNRRDLNEVRVLGEEAADFELGIHPFLEAPEHLQHQPLAEDHGVVALLGRRQGGLELDRLRSPQAQERARGGSDQRPGRSRRAPPTSDRRQEGLGKAGWPQSIVQEPTLILAIRTQPADRRMRPSLQDLRRLRWLGVGDRQQVGFGIAIPVGHLDRGQISRSIRTGHIDRIRDLDRLQSPRLTREPAPLPHIAGQDALQALFGRAAHQDGVPAVGGFDLRQRECGRGRVAQAERRGSGLEREPEERVRTKGQEVRGFPDHGQLGRAEQLDRDQTLPLRQVEVDRLEKSREVGDAQDLFGLVAPHKRQDLSVLRPQQLQGAPPEGTVALAQCDQPFHPRQQRVRILVLGLDIDGFVVVLGVGDHGQVQALAVGAGESGVAVATPLHRGAYPVAVSQEDVVAHSDLVAVVDDRCPRQREQQPVHQLDAAPFVAEQRGEAAPDAEIDACRAILRVGAIHVVALLVCDHLERQLVVVPQKQRPLAVVRDRWGLGQDVDDRKAVFHPDRHEKPGHEWEMEGHVTFVAFAKVSSRILGPLVGL